jgi:hypothetical protein
MREEVRLVPGDGQDGPVDVLNGPPESIELPIVESGEHATHQIVTDHLDVGQNLASALADPDEDHAAVVRAAEALDEATFLHPVDEAGGVRIGDVEQFGDPAHGQLAVAIQHRHQVEVTHRDALPDQPLAGDTTELANGRTKLADDGIDEGRPLTRRDSS